MEGSRQVAVDPFSRSASHTPIAHVAVARSPPPPTFHTPVTQHIPALGRVMPCRHIAGSTSAAARPRNAQLLRKLRTGSTQLRRTVGTHSGAYWQQVRAWVRTSGSHPPTRTWCEPARQPVIKSYGYQALVSTVVSRVLPCFPLATIAVNLGVSLAERGFAKTNPMNAPPPAIGMSDFRC